MAKKLVFQIGAHHPDGPGAALKPPALEAVERTERGWAGHYCCGPQCRFHLNTLLRRGETRIIVSTIGDLWTHGDTKAQEIGDKRYYETMAFHAKKKMGYWEVDAERELDFESKWAIGHLDHLADEEANEMHETVVDEMTKRLQEGEIDG